MMEFQNVDELYQRRKRRWLSYGRALLTIGILGLITVFLLAVTQSSGRQKGEEHLSQVISADEEQLIHQSETVESRKDGDSPISDQLANRKVVKRSVAVDRKVPKKLDSNEAQSLNDVNSDSDPKTDNQHSKLFRRQHGTSSNPRHLHSNGDVFYRIGYKCTPIRKPSKLKPLELKRPRDQSGRLCCS